MGLLGSAFSAIGGAITSGARALFEGGGRGLLETGGLVGDIAQAFGAESKTFQRLAVLNDPVAVSVSPIASPGAAIGTTFAPSAFGFSPLADLRALNARVGAGVESFLGLEPGRTFPTPGDRRDPVGLLGSAGAPTSALGPTPALPSFVATERGFRATTASVVPVRQLHAINPLTGKLETWLHAGHPTAWSRVNVKKRRRCPR